MNNFYKQVKKPLVTAKYGNVFSVIYLAVFVIFFILNVKKSNVFLVDFTCRFLRLALKREVVRHPRRKILLNAYKC